MSDLKIRTAGLADVTVLAALIAGFRNHLDAKLPTDAEIQAHLPRALDDPGIEFSCAWLDGEAVGYRQTRFFISVWPLARALPRRA